MNSKLKQLYQDVILYHNKQPVNFEQLADANVVLKAYNPICGDRFKIFLRLKEGQIQKVSFHGYGCAISKASCSVMVATIQGLPLADVPSIFEEFDWVVEDGGDEEKARETFQAFAAAKSFPGRKQCVTLGWDELRSFVKSKENLEH